MKLKIKCIQNPLWITSAWDVTFDGKTERFNSHLAAITHADKVWKRFYKEQAAFSMVMIIAINNLNQIELEFITKLCQSRCKGITKKQYGYLKGIHERQVREW